MPVYSPPTFGTTYVDATARPTFLKDWLNSVGDALNLGFATGVGGWTAFTPVLTASTSNPTLGSGSVQVGHYAKIGKLIVAHWGVRFGTSGQAKGSGTYWVSGMPTGKGRGAAAGLTSDLVAFGKLWRGYSGLDLVAGAHLDCSWHWADGTYTKVLGVMAPGSQGNDVNQTKKTSHHTGIGTSATDVTGLSVAFTPYRARTRVRVYAEVIVCHETAADTEIFVEIADGSTTLRRVAVTPPKIGSTGFGTGLMTVPVTYIDENPTVGTAKTYKVRAYTTSGTCAVFGSSDAPSTIEAVELPGSSSSGLAENTDYITDVAPWEWDDGTGGPELWGMMVYEAA